MSPKQTALLNLEFHPLTAERWHNLETLFGKQVSCGDCWCMWWRLTRSQFNKQKGEGNRKALKKIVDSGQTPGIIAYAGGQPVAWCSVAPRESYPSLERSRTLKRVDEQPVWSVVCFFVDKSFRGKGILVPLLKAAVDYAKENNAKIVEGYPVESKKTLPPSFVYTGVPSVFHKVGFVEVMRRSETRPVMRYFIQHTRVK